MKNITSLILAAVVAFFSVSGVWGQDFEWVKSKNGSNAWVGVHVEPSPVNIDDNDYEAYEPDEYSAIPCNVGDTLTLKFIIGKSAPKGVFYGHLTRDIVKYNKEPETTDPSEVSEYFYDGSDVNAGKYRNMFAWPNAESGLQLSRVPGVSFSSSQDNLVSLKIIVPEKGGQSSDDYYLEQYPLWIVFTEYYKSTPVNWCLDARPGATGIKQHSAQSRTMPFSIMSNGTDLSIALPDEQQAIITVHSLDGSTVMHKSAARRSITIPASLMSSGMYLLSITGNTSRVTQSLLIP
ncbi:MAG: T9SS type A sorting domain-containing protein [Chitinivibrionales bacterium]|nr:T9SS type A sorting domain-containing protein [Chitinivibrionales bacterium]